VTDPEDGHAAIVPQKFGGRDSLVSRHQAAAVVLEEHS
jgi:hypothetical protein